MPKYYLSGVVAMCLSSPAWANDAPSAENADGLGNPEITITATRSPAKIEDVPVTVTVIDDEQIADELATDIKDLVRFEPGVTVRRQPARFGSALGSAGRAGNESFNIRGIGGNRVLIQVDGIRSPDGFAFGAQSAGRGGFTDVGLVKSVEILRGPASALYGSDGLSGAVSFITSDPVDLIDGDKNLGGFMRAQYSSADEEFAGTSAVAGRLGDFSAMVAYTRRDFRELDNKGTKDVEGAERTTPNPQDGESNAFLGKLVWQSGGHRVRLTGEYLEREVSSHVLSGLGPVFLFGPSPTWNVDRLEAFDTTERKRVSLDYTWQGEGIIDYARIAAYWQDGEDFQFTAEDRTQLSFIPAPDRTRINTFENEVYGGLAELRSEFNMGSTKHRLIFGGDISWTEQAGLRDGSIPPTGEIFPTRAFPKTDFTLAGVFIGDEISFADGAMTVFPALRYDYYDLNPANDPLLPTFTAEGQDGSRLSPKIGITFKPSETVRIYGNYSQGFKAPSPSQVNNFFENLAFGYTSEPNPDLGPETSESFEAGVRYVDDRFSIGVAGFFAHYDNFIRQEVVGGSFRPKDPAIFQFINIDEVDVHGVEAKLNYTHENGFRVRFAMAYADGEESFGGGVIPLESIDPLNAVLGLGYRDPESRFGGELIASYNARKSRGETSIIVDGDRQSVCNTECFRPDESLLLDATAFVRFAENVTLRAGLFNIFDSKYAAWSDVRGLSASSGVTDAYTRPGRNFSMSASLSF